MRKRTYRKRRYCRFWQTQKQTHRRKRACSFGGYFKLIIRRWK